MICNYDYLPNSYAERPETSTSIGNLICGGDLVKMPFPCGLMERAVSSGLLPGNDILCRQGLQRRSLLSVNFRLKRIYTGKTNLWGF